jgi:ferrochelatase
MEARAVSAAGPAGLVVMAYGTPRSPDEVEAYYTHIRRGRPPAPEQLADLVRRYDAIGGLSPLAARTASQLAAIAGALEAAEPGRWVTEPGNKHAAPFVEEAVGALVAAGAAPIVGLVLAPHFSRGSVADYHARAAAAAGADAAYAGIDSWSDEPAWLDAQAARVREALGGLPAGTHVLFTAHSLPERVLAGDPYTDQLAASAAAIAARAGLPAAPTTTATSVDGPARAGGGWSLAWQSAGRTPEPWRGPDVLEVIDGIADAGSATSVLVCPQGFVSDHLEVLYDLDVDAATVAAKRGLAFARTASINDEPAVMAALAARVRAAAA